ncbi:hypothetical protein SISNIDRAFT_38274 [Sistotremastrum niveocremeum HHB9708]|uniref:Uncharacterized protein n=1 Tax=Sistotremastrum niveocremeum HHB9708 TaxID=1314777 RepID=A0A164VP79_9AGAM|nr:hypothetical protein SISNIDRAFT_38274 [Sistotremastrum niveocremeum HHB9708]
MALLSGAENLPVKSSVERDVSIPTCARTLNRGVLYPLYPAQLILDFAAVSSHYHPTSTRACPTVRSESRLSLSMSAIFASPKKNSYHFPRTCPQVSRPLSVLVRSHDIFDKLTNNFCTGESHTGWLRRFLPLFTIAYRLNSGLPIDDAPDIEPLEETDLPDLPDEILAMIFARVVEDANENHFTLDWHYLFTM